MAVGFMIIFILIVFMSVQTSVRVKDWGSEVSLWKDTVKENPLSMVGWNNLGRAYARRGKLDEAEKALLRAHELDPQRADILVNLGSTMLKKKDFASARLYYEKAVKLNPFDVKSLINLANLLAQEGDCHGAIIKYYDILRIEPEEAHTHYNLAQCFLKLDDTQKAGYHAAMALRIDPEYTKARKLLMDMQEKDVSSEE
jgi:tetratricopeptide (TPR) repeat protein